VLARQLAGGLSVRAFCRREGVSEPAFYARRRSLQRRDADYRCDAANAHRPAFLPVQLRPEVGNGIAIHLRGGRVLHLPTSMAPAEVAAVVHAIEARPASVEGVA
jgi:hypothetical protein